MEFFEKAHFVKNKVSPKKDRKSEAKVKKQLKYMLYGYKYNDNNLIKNSEVINCSDDSISVSGFSDLNLTNSSSEINTTQATTLSNVDNMSMSDVDEFTLSETSDVSLSTWATDKSINKRENDSDSFTVDNEDSQLLSKELSSDETSSDETSSDETSFEISESVLSDNMLETSTEISEDLEPFDADGTLASKILNKLGQKEKDEMDSKRGKKRKLTEINSRHRENLSSGENDTYIFNEESFISNRQGLNELEELFSHDNDLNSSSSQTDVSDHKSIQDDENISPSDQEVNKSQKIFIHDDESASSKVQFSEYNIILDENNKTPPYVSLTVPNMSVQTLSQVLKDYRHPTIKNIPTYSQNITFSSTNMDMFSTECDDVQMGKVINNFMKVEVDEETMSGVKLPVNEVEEEQNTHDMDLVSDDQVNEQITCTENTNTDDTTQSEQMREREASLDSIDTKFFNSVKVFYGKNQCIFILKHPAEIFIHGKVKVIALWGSIEVFGYTLNDNPCELYAPNYNYAQQLKTKEEPNICKALFSKLTSAGISVPEAEEIVTNLNTYDGVISFQPLKSQKMDFVENNFSVTDLFTKTSNNTENCFMKASQILKCSLYLSRPWKCFEENTSWKQVLKHGFKKHSRGIVCGGKGAGKSTFLRYYVNKLLAQGPVLVIDLDPGQCEFTVAGSISASVVNQPLLGPNFTHLKKPEIMFNMGMINTMDNPKRYANTVQTLITHCFTNEQYQEMPWIINTMGMTNNMGHIFMTLTIILSQPTFLLQIDSKNAKKRFEAYLNPETIRKFYYEDYKKSYIFTNVSYPDQLNYAFFVSNHRESSMKNKFSLAPRDERYLNFLAYFGELLNIQNGLSLLGITPYEVPLQSLNIALNIKISEDKIAKLINGKVIALCQYTSDTNTRKIFTLSDEALLCYGHGLIRGIDNEKEMLYIITPTPVNTLHLVNTLLYADWVPELRGQEAYLPDGIPVPYRKASMYEQKQFMFSPRRRYNPLQLLKMSR